MVKLDYNRDYYADLELPGPVDIAEVKKQFKKLGELRQDRGGGSRKILRASY